MRKLPPLNAVRAFEAAARHVSFSKAARELFVTHGAVSKQVAALESWLGTELFHRSPSQISLSEAGKAFLASVTPALDRIAQASSLLLEQKESSVLRVNAPPTFTMRWLIPRLSTFQRRFPGVQVKLTTSTAPISFAGQAYDMAIRGARQPLAGMHAVPFMTEEILPICHPDLLAKGSLREPLDLRCQTLISYDTEPVSWRDWLGLAGLADIHPQHSLQFEQMFFALQAAAEGLGVVLVPLFLVADDVIAGHLCAPFGFALAHQRQYYLCTAQRPEAGSVPAAFIEWLLQEGRDTELAIHALGQGLGSAQVQQL